MVEAGWGRIVNISSIQRAVRPAFMTHYVAAKSGSTG